MKQQQFKKTVLASLLALTSGVALSAPYEIVDLGGLGGDQSYAFGINNNGTVVGYANGPLLNDGSEDREFGLHATSYTGGTVNDLGAFGDNTSLAFKINDNEKAVGYAVDSIERESNGETFDSIESFATTYENGVIEKVTFDVDIRNSQATDINNGGTIVGFGDYLTDDSGSFPVFVRKGYIKDSSDNVTIIEDLDPELDLVTIVTALNNNDKVVGITQAVDDNSVTRNRAFVYDPNFSSEITVIPFIENRSTVATDINDNDLIVGRAQDQDGFYYAFSYDSNSGADQLNRIPYFGQDFKDATANAVNLQGDIVGTALVVPYSPSGINSYSGFLYKDGVLNDLNDLIPCDSGWEIQQAQDINDSGEIVGFGIYQGEIKAFKLIPSGGQIESCDNSGNDSKGGGSVPVFIFFLLGALYILRRKA